MPRVRRRRDLGQRPVAESTRALEDDRPSPPTGRLERAAYKHGWGINVIRRLEGGEQYLFGALNGDK